MSLDVLTIIMAGGEGKRLWPLTAERNKPAVPFGGKYRMVDIPLSNAANSGLNRVYVVTQGRDFSFMEHMKHAWHIDSLDGFVTTISPQEPGSMYMGTADSVRQIIKYIQRQNPDFVLVAPGDNIVKMNYQTFVQFLVSRPNADAAVALVEMPLQRASELGSASLSPDSWITAFKEKDPNTPFRASDNQHFFASMGTYAFRTAVLLDVLN